ncbi:MAG: hypothetical protein ACM3IJ_03440 [Candidatus Levyibacteriota bacterium]
MRKFLFALIPFSYLLLLLFTKDISMLGDLGRHLKMGEVVLKCLCVPQTNLFSYTHPNFPIVNHEWFAEVIFYLVSLLGLQALLVFKVIMVLLTFSILYLVAIKKGSIFWAIIFSLLSITIFSLRFYVLPELFSYLFISVFIFLVEKYKESGKLYWLFGLPAIELLWVNSHIYFILGLGIYLFFLAEEYLRSKKIKKNLLIIGGFLLVSIFINPSFVKGALLPFTFSSNYNFNVEENTSPLKIFESTSTNQNIAYTLVLQVMTFEFLMLLFLIGFSTKLWKKGNLGNALVGAFLGLRYTRCIPLFGVLGLVYLVESFTKLEETLKKKMEKSNLTILKGMSVAIVVFIVGFHIKGLFDYDLLHFQFVPSAEKAADFIVNNHIKGNIFNNYIVGNYLIYRLYPRQQVFIDARPEAYPGPFFDEYYRMMADPGFFKKQAEKYHINAVVFNVATDDPTRIRPFLLPLLLGSEWIPVYADGNVTILVKNSEVNKGVIQKFKLNIPKT